MLASYTDVRFKTIPVGNYPLGWVASPALSLPAEPVSLADLAAWPIITFSRTTQPYGVIREMFSSMRVPPMSLAPDCSTWTTPLWPIFTHETWMLSIQPR